MSGRQAFSAFVVALGLVATGCGDQAPQVSQDDLTSAEGVERELVLKGLVYVDPGATDRVVSRAVQRQVRALQN